MKSLVLADIHANLPALEAVLEREGPFDEVIFLGDAVVCGPHPDEVLERLARLPGVFIRGNHDVEPFRREFTEGETNPDRIYMRWTRDRIAPERRRFLESFEETRVIERGGRTFRLHHGHFRRRPGSFLARPGLPRLVRFPVKVATRLFRPPWDSRIWPDAPPDVFRAIARVFPEPCILLAHSHVQYRIEVGGTVFLNPGSVGQPRLGRPVAGYAVIEDGVVSLRQTPYDVEAVCRDLDRVPVDDAFRGMWREGYRRGRLPDRYPLRDWGPLIAAGYV